MPRRKRVEPDEDNVQDGNNFRTSTGGTPIAFVSYQGPHRRTTAATRRVIHQQAMKEIGKTRRRPRKAKSVVLDLSLLESSGRHAPSPSWWLGVRWTLTDGLNMVTTFNVELDALGRTLLANIFRDDSGGQQRPLRDAWFSVGLADKAAFLAVLSNSALHLSSMRKGGLAADETAAAVRYQTEAVSIISRRLENHSAQGDESLDLSDENIGAVSGLLCNADIRGSKIDWKTHMKGMRELVRLRGGIDELDSNEALRVTLSWVELRGAFMFDVEPLFPIPRQWQHRAPTIPADQKQQADDVWEKFRKIWEVNFPSEPRWLNLIEEMAQFSHASLPCPSLLSSGSSMHHHHHHLSEHQGVWTNSMIHKLLSFRPSRDESSSSSSSPLVFRTQESVRLGCLLYMASVWRFFGVAPIVPDTLLARLRSVLGESIESWGSMWTLELWAVYMGATEALNGPSEAWFLDRLVALCKTNGIQNWAEMTDAVQGVLWFACLSDSRHKQLEARTQTSFFVTKRQ